MMMMMVVVFLYVLGSQALFTSRVCAGVDGITERYDGWIPKKLHGIRRRHSRNAKMT